MSIINKSFLPLLALCFVSVSSAAFIPRKLEVEPPLSASTVTSKVPRAIDAVQAPAPVNAVTSKIPRSFDVVQPPAPVNAVASKIPRDIDTVQVWGEEEMPSDAIATPDMVLAYMTTNAGDREEETPDEDSERMNAMASSYRANESKDESANDSDMMDSTTLMDGISIQSFSRRFFKEHLQESGITPKPINIKEEERKEERKERRTLLIDPSSAESTMPVSVPRQLSVSPSGMKSTIPVPDSPSPVAYGPKVPIPMAAREEMLPAPVAYKASRLNVINVKN